jgi:hypothetical protein
MSQAHAVDIDADAPELTIDCEYAYPVENVFASCAQR